MATSHPLGTQSALSVLRDGGNAMDAALAASATLCVVEPHMTGIGGDCFAIVAEPDGSLHGLNGSGRSAATANADRFRDQGFTEIDDQSVHSVTVPGAVKAWETLHNRFGSTDFARLFADAVRYAEDGFPVAPRVAYDWQKLTEKLASREVSSEILLKDGRAPRIGDVWRFPALALALREIAVGGSDRFYTGEIATDIADAVQSEGGLLSEADLAGVSVDWVEPLSAGYRDRHLHELPPNGQGLTALIMAKLVERLGDPADMPDVERLHLLVECGRIAYSVRDTHIADPNHMQTTSEALLSDAFIGNLAKLYDADARNSDIILPPPPRGDTIYISVVDRDRRAVSFINSVFSGFGSGLVTPKFGIALQNRGSGFTLEAGHPNEIGPAKRPFHTIIPGMITKNGAVTHCFGVMGGSYQSMGHGHVMSNLLDLGMDPQAALDAPRLFWDESGSLTVEDGVSPEILAGLAAKGHEISPGALHGGGQIIELDQKRGILIAGSDPRKDGCAAGF